MYYLYANNFRGFQNALIPIKEVNFLVGENSTGKTSIMSLLHILTNFRFWMRSMDFAIEGTNLRNFRDIVSAHSDDKKYFSVGMCSLNPGGNEQSGVYLITFEENEGMPKLSRYTYQTNGKLIDVVFGKDRLAYRLEESVDQFIYRFEDVRKWFDKWKNLHFTKKGRYKILRAPFGGPITSSLGALNSYLLKGSAEKEKILSIEFGTPYRRTTWLAPIRTKPKRTYDEYNLEFSPEGEHTPYLIKNYLRKKGKREQFEKYLGGFGENSGLFQEIKIKKFGQNTTAPFELDVTLNKTELKIVDVGYGVSQSLPVVVELFERGAGTCYLIQQPEVHLHPKAQAAMGELFFELNVKENKQFIIETHSDFVIDRFRMKLRDSKKKTEAQVLYFTRDFNGNNVYPVEIMENGEYADNQPSGYRDFFVREQMNILGIKC